MTEHCLHEQDWGRMLTNIEGLVKDFYGNGQPGMAVVIPKLETKVNELVIQSHANATAISALAKFITEIKAVDQYKEKEKLSASQRTVIIVTSIIGASGVAATLVAAVI